jgi:hypothetical protein
VSTASARNGSTIPFYLATYVATLQLAVRSPFPETLRLRYSSEQLIAEVMKNEPKRRVGRPAAGPGGQKRTEMRHQVTARIPDGPYALLRALSAALQLSQADVVVRALAALTDSLPADVRKVVQVLQRQHGRQQK